MRPTLHAVLDFGHASGQTLGVKGAGCSIDAVAAVGDSQNPTPSSMKGPFVGMVGIAHVLTGSSGRWNGRAVRRSGHPWRAGHARTW
ncbi:hypothetical protein [Burkholderia sp. GS2Y]|uniref:Uncharacterized protein n=1 Tax=Burkholderia theae TaxID=3143496 RepID=A0ABU9WJB0_9BURK